MVNDWTNSVAGVTFRKPCDISMFAYSNMFKNEKNNIHMCFGR